jgi:acyl-CoA reductase-like NAD-dependent aldehyde dehydrogenase
MQDEIFAPLLPILRYNSLDWVIKHINNHDKPLACYVFAGDAKVQDAILTQTSSGCCVINDTMMQMTNEE